MSDLKSFYKIAVIACAALLALSCAKDLDHQICKGIEFVEYHLQIEDKKSGDAHFAAWTRETTLDSTYSLDIEFKGIANMKPGQRTVPVSVHFSNPLINGGAGFTSEYRGSIFLIKKTETEAEISFKKVTMNILNTDYLFNGCILCPIE